MNLIEGLIVGGYVSIKTFIMNNILLTLSICVLLWVLILAFMPKNEDER